MSAKYDRELGMHRRIRRRDFINGTAAAIAGAVLEVANPTHA
jgi:hypothetical protein